MEVTAAVPRTLTPVTPNAFLRYYYPRRREFERAGERQEPRAASRDGSCSAPVAPFRRMSLAPKRATYEDVLQADPRLVAEVIDGVLHTSPRPATPHAQASAVLGEELGPPFKRGKGGPGGWIILWEPELHLGLGPDILVPDLAGWRRETLPALPDAPYLTLRPDWVAEVLSPSTRRWDRALKLPVYQRECVQHLWFVDPEAKTLEILRLDGASYRLVVTFAGTEPVRAEPFGAIALDIAALWSR